MSATIIRAVKARKEKENIILSIECIDSNTTAPYHWVEKEYGNITEIWKSWIKALRKGGYYEGTYSLAQWNSPTHPSMMTRLPPCTNRINKSLSHMIVRAIKSL